MNPPNSSYSVRTGLLDHIRDVDQVCQTVPIEARTRLVSHFGHKRGESYRIIRQGYGYEVYNIDQFRLVVLIVVHKRTESLVDILISILRLAIGLRVGSS